MTQLSYLWNGVITGDAVQAPYEKVDFNLYTLGAFCADDAVYVLPGYLNNLRIYSQNAASGNSVTIATGAALLGNYLFINDAAVSLVLDQAPANFYRFDYVVLEVDDDAQTVRLAIVKGTAVSDVDYLTLPALDDTQYPLAKVFINGTVAYLADKYVFDLRNFAMTNYSLKHFGHRDYNLIRNSEFMAYPAPTTADPSFWVTSVVSHDEETKFSFMSRGRSFRIREGTLTQTFSIDKISDDLTLSLRGSIQGVVKGDIITVKLINSAGVTLKENEIPFLSVDEEFEFQFSIADTSVAEFYTLEIYTDGYTNIGQFIIVQGYHVGPFRQFKEVIPFNYACTDALWNNTAKNSGTTSITLSTSFGNNIILDQTKAVMLLLKARDSGSAAGNASLAIQGWAAPFNAIYGKVELDGITNDTYRAKTCVAPTDQIISALGSKYPRFRIVVVATGAGTLDATVHIMGIII